MQDNTGGGWVRIFGGGCLVNATVTSLLVLVGTAAFRLTVDSILFPFLIGATLSFALNYYYLMRRPDDIDPRRKLVLILGGVFVGSLVSVFVITALLLFTTGLG